MLKKFCLTFISLLLCIGLSNSTVSAGNSQDMYFKTFEYKIADQYVAENIGNFLNSESKINPINIDEVQVGAGIYVEEFNSNTTLPTFYYPVYIAGDLKYVYRIYDGGNGEYESIFSAAYVDYLNQLAATTEEEAVELAQNNGNEIAIYGDSYEVIKPSDFGDQVDETVINEYQARRNNDLMIQNVKDKSIEFKKYPQSRTYFVYLIDYEETQGQQQWCLGFVTANAIRTKSGRNVTTPSLASYYGLSVNDGFSWNQVRDACNRYGVVFSGAYSGVVPFSNLEKQITSWNLALGSYNNSSRGNHAFLIHGIDGTRIRFWNPWNNYSEWGSTVSTIQSRGYTWRMYAYGYYS